MATLTPHSAPAATEPAPGGIWLASDPTFVHMRQWGDEWLVFHERSGETHLLGPLAVALCRRLQAGSGPETAVIEGALDTVGCPGDLELAAMARQTLRHLGDIGLARFRSR